MGRLKILGFLFVFCLSLPSFASDGQRGFVKTRLSEALWIIVDIEGQTTIGTYCHKDREYFILSCVPNSSIFSIYFPHQGFRLRTSWIKETVVLDSRKGDLFSDQIKIILKNRIFLENLIPFNLVLASPLTHGSQEAFILGFGEFIGNTENDTIISGRFTKFRRLLLEENISDRFKEISLAVKPTVRRSSFVRGLFRKVNRVLACCSSLPLQFGDLSFPNLVSQDFVSPSFRGSLIVDNEGFCHGTFSRNGPLSMKEAYDLLILRKGPSSHRFAVVYVVQGKEQKSSFCPLSRELIE